MPEKLLVVTLENKPGTIVDVLTALDRVNVGVEAFAGTAFGDEGRAVLLTDNPDDAFDELRREGFQVDTQTAIVMMSSTDPAETRRLFSLLKDADVNVGSLLTTRDGRYVAAVSDYAKAADVLEGAAVVT